ncbi:DUF4198 domain-containing protein [Arcobacter defluvii]|uniref:DUF4198 domain-containing protein n=1 Tax=Arcobacter defluvii TaxID=873191 RepID=A0AAE7BFF9_9BACT|nr:DUF4198 domain-containing protein [Arcobacter defluvii]QKF76921.1 DUF4198 domain-containing protein [Arcobacter defluvii]RXI33743.1 hypothetical protein CP964_04825 [Arcobacter defluvii]
MKKLVYLIFLSLFATISLNAHEIWLELDDKKDEAKLFFGHFDGKQLESGEKFSRIKEGEVYPTELLKEVKKNNNNITYVLNKKGDITIVRTSEPRKARDSEIIENKIAYSKAGRTNTQVVTDFDIIPIEKNSNTFKIVFKNEPIKKSKIRVISPTGWEKTFDSNDKGEFTIHTPWIGKYLIQANFEDETKGEIDGKEYDKTIHAITYTIDVEQGIPWNIKR